MIDFHAPPLRDVLEILLRDMNSGGNILFAGKQLTKKLLPKVKPRALKSDAEKISRTRSAAEVCTPARVVKFMLDALDDHNPDSRWLEIACGEAPFITTRYDAESGEPIPAQSRTGVLDRKLRLARDLSDAKRAVQTVYGYELHGDSLLIARANVLLTFIERVGACHPNDLAELAEIIAWNFFQLDGTQDDGMFGIKIVDWHDGRKFTFGGSTVKKFDFVIGNPPYQEDNGIDKSRRAPVYNILMSVAHQFGKTAELITPARFLFGAGGTPKDFNQRMLGDPHFKVLDYAPDARKYFKGVEIKGGVAITLRDETKDFGAIKTFIPEAELKTAHVKVCVDNPDFRPLSEIIYTQIVYKLSEKFFAERPELICRLQKPNDNALRSNIFERLPQIFFDAKPVDGHEYISIYGLADKKRTSKWIRRDWVNEPELLTKWKILLPEANNTGILGERLVTPLVGPPLVGPPLVGPPLVGNTETFISVGAFDSEVQARACLAYIKSKFCRAMLGILKRTQHNPPQTWRFVPLQDFNPATSDIDWSGDVDAQLYHKYGLDAAEIDFIETNIKEMA